MLGKLLKYEIKSTARVFLPFFIAILVLSLVNKLSFAFLSNPAPAWQIPKALLAFLYVLMIFAAFVLCVIITIQRFYKNLLGPEGYLMFTLPVTPTANVLSKGIVALMWTVSTCLVTLASIFILLPDYDWMHHFQREWRDVTQEILEKSGLNINVVLLLGFVLMLVAFCAFIMEIYLAISIGQLANDHKLLCSFGAFIGIYIAEQIINSIFLSMILLPQFPDLIGDSVNVTYVQTQFPSYVVGLLIFAIVAELVYTSACFFATRFLLGKKLNLE